MLVKSSLCRRATRVGTKHTQEDHDRDDQEIGDYTQHAESCELLVMLIQRTLLRRAADSRVRCLANLRRNILSDARLASCKLERVELVI